ncbi:integrase [Thermodesulfobacteriota bacterium]
MAILAECPSCHQKQSVRNKLCSCGADLDKAKQSKKVKYWINYRLPNGKQKRESVSSFEGLNGFSIEAARTAESKKKVQKAEKRLMDIKEDSRMTFRELTDWYLELEMVKALASYWLVDLCLKKFNKIFGDAIVSKIKPSDLENYQAKRRKDGLADATIDHEVGKAKTVVYKAFENDLVSGGTLKNFKVVKKLLKKGADVRDRILSRDEFDRLMEHLPRHTAAIVATGYYTGMREGEILSLIWNKVDLKDRLISLEKADTKDKEARKIPIMAELYEILKAVPRNIHNPHVFLFRGKPIKDLRSGLRKACVEAGVIYGRFTKGGFIFHDLRHTFNTNMRKAGIQESVIMAITGHSTREMFDRYNTIDEEDTRKAVDQLQGYFRNVDQTVDQVDKNEKQ